jgi:hypothetical protein
MPPVVLAICGLLIALFTGSFETTSQWLTAIPGLKVTAIAGLGFGVLWLAVTIFYASAARARIPVRSAAVGGAIGALALIIVFWVFTAFQIGVSQAAAVGSAFLAVPVFLLWIFSSWCSVLVGAEIAVAHRTDRVLVHGARAFRLDAAGERQTGAAIMLLMAGTPPSNDNEPEIPSDNLARALRLPPALVRDLCMRLVERGFLAEAPLGFSLACDPDRTSIAAVADAMDRDPALEAARREPLGPLMPEMQRDLARCSQACQGTDGPSKTLRELAGVRREPVVSAKASSHQR